MATENAPLLPIQASLKAMATPPQPHALLGMALVALSAVCFSWMSTFVKYETYYMTSMEAVFWRSSISWCINYGVIRYTGQSVSIHLADRKMLVFRCFVGFTSIAFAFYAVSKMVLADASVLVFTSPVITFFFGACMLGESIDAVSLTFAMTSFTGLIFVVRPGFVFGYADTEGAGSWDAYAAGMLGAVFQALVYISVRKLKHIHFLVMLHYFMMFSSSVSLIYIALFQRRFVLPSTPLLWVAVLGTGFFTFLGQSFLTKGFQLEKAGIASVMRYLDVVCVFFWDQIFLGEQINAWSVVGAVIICGSACLIALRKAQVI